MYTHKFIPNNVFMKETAPKFTALLNAYGFNAKLVTDGILFNKEQIQGMKWANVPHLLWMNKQYLLNAERI
jgi:hypothetical protein